MDFSIFHSKWHGIFGQVPTAIIIFQDLSGFVKTMSFGSNADRRNPFQKTSFLSIENLKKQLKFIDS
jgi:hypothetical protein